MDVVDMLTSVQQGLDRVHRHFKQVEVQLVPRGPAGKDRVEQVKSYFSGRHDGIEWTRDRVVSSVAETSRIVTSSHRELDQCRCGDDCRQGGKVIQRPGLVRTSFRVPKNQTLERFGKRGKFGPARLAQPTCGVD